MQTSRKIIAATASLLATGGLCTVVAVGSQGSASGTEQAASSKRVVLRFGDTTTQFRNFGPNRFIASGIDRRAGSLVGYSNLHGRFNPGDETWTIYSTFTLRGGIIYVTFESDDEETYDGEVTGGTGRYEEATGTATAAANFDDDDGVTRIRIDYDPA